MRLIEFAELERERLQRLFQRYEKWAAELPEVKFFQFEDGERTRYYITTPEKRKRQYIGWRENEALLRKLLLRQNARKNIRAAEKNLKAIERLLKEWIPVEDMVPGDECEIVGLRGEKEFPKSQNPYKKEELIHDTGLGFYTRSKSEAIVARRLFAHGLWFAYEAPLRVKSRFGYWKTIYPDFTIWMDDGRIIYLEHVGKLQEEKYQKKFLNKILEYHKNGYLISRDVFITMDGPDGDIDISAIDALIRTF